MRVEDVMAPSPPMIRTAGLTVASAIAAFVSQNIV